MEVSYQARIRLSSGALIKMEHFYRFINERSFIYAILPQFCALSSDRVRAQRILTVRHRLQATGCRGYSPKPLVNFWQISTHTILAG